MVVNKRCTSFEVHCERVLFMDVYETHMERLRYMCFGRKKTPCGFQDHCYFMLTKATTDSPKCLDKLAAWFGPGAVVTPLFGSLRCDVGYSQCEDVYTKLGTEPSPGKRTDLQELTTALRKKQTTLHEIIEQYPYMYHLYGRTLQATVHQICLAKTRTEPTLGIWYYGPTKSGKSSRCFENYNMETHYQKKWDQPFWQGYTGQEITIMDDFNHQVSYEELLHLCDQWPYHVSIDAEKSVPFVSKKIIVTSSMHPSIMFDDCEQLLSRFQVIPCQPFPTLDVLSLETLLEQPYEPLPGFNDVLDKLLNE